MGNDAIWARWAWVAVLVSTAAFAQGALTGEVKEKLDASAYSYLRIATPGGDAWAAVPTAQVKVGQQVTIAAQTTMTHFPSKTLGRTFDRIVFGTLAELAGAPPEAPAAAPAPVAAPGASLITPRQLPKSAARAATAAAGTLEGQVLETLEVPSYTYLRLKTADGEQWAAVPTASVKPGARVRILNPMVMQGFESKSLKRRFERIVFGSLGG